MRPGATCDGGVSGRGGGVVEMEEGGGRMRGEG
jgi:hypothetical protein